MVARVDDFFWKLLWVLRVNLLVKINWQKFLMPLFVCVLGVLNFRFFSRKVWVFQLFKLFLKVQKIEYLSNFLILVCKLGNCLNQVTKTWKKNRLVFQQNFFKFFRLLEYLIFGIIFLLKTAFRLWKCVLSWSHIQTFRSQLVKLELKLKDFWILC